MARLLDLIAFVLNCCISEITPAEYQVGIKWYTADPAELIVQRRALEQKQQKSS